MNAPFPLELTAAAMDRVRDVVYDESRGRVLRVYVQGGGCAGFSYQFALEDTAATDDVVAQFAEFSVAIDPFTAPLLQGATLDYEEGLMASHFVVRNPNASHTCGCGSSFGV